MGKKNDYESRVRKKMKGREGMNDNKIDRKIKINVRKKMIMKRGGGKKMISRKNIDPCVWLLASFQ